MEKINTTYKQWSCVKVCSTVLDSGASWFYNRFVRLFFVACVFVDDYIVVLNELYHCSLCQNLTFLTASRSKHARIFLELVLSSLGVQIFRCYALKYLDWESNTSK